MKTFFEELAARVIDLAFWFGLGVLVTLAATVLFHAATTP